MQDRRHWIVRQIAIITACSVVLSGSVTAIARNTLVLATTGVVVGAPDGSSESIDGGWPRSYTTPAGASVVLYQPQIASWENQEKITLFAAVAYTPIGGQRSLGTIEAVANTNVSVAERLVSYSSLRISEANFPTLDKSQVQDIAAELSSTIHDGIISLDRVLSSMDKSQIIARNVEGLNVDPPGIFFSQTPAILVNFEGDPIWSPIMGTDLKYAVNTNWDFFQDTSTSALYLRNNTSWLRSTTMSGVWTPATLPDTFNMLPASENWRAARAAIPGKKLSMNDVPRVFISHVPAEMILLKGAPDYDQVSDTNLYWVSNTESDVFRQGKTGFIYYLVAGRWFSAADFTGPWTFASLNLPADFKKIPLDHPRSRVLASVPGTMQAAEAVLLAQVPQSARVNKTLQAPQVSYQGNPQFVPIQQTDLQRAVNTDKQIIKVGDLYYMCFQAVWFVSMTPTGPWQVTGSIPKEIYSIPPQSPVHNVTYVTVVNDNPDWVDFSAVAAYTGLMVAWGCAVWGTGYYYPPYVWRGGFYPVYYPHYPTYGYSAWYNPWTGTYGRGASVYGPYGGAGMTARYNPATGTYARGAAAYGPYGSRAAGQAYNPRTGAYAATRQGSNIYGSWGTTSVTRGDQWATTSRVTNNMTGATTRVARTSQGDVYAGHDGNVYRNDNGSWQKYDNGSWNGVQQARSGALSTGVDSSTFSQLNRESAARTEGAQRASDLDSFQSSSFGRDSLGGNAFGGNTFGGSTVGDSFGGGSRFGSFRPSGGFGGGGFGGRRR